MFFCAMSASMRCTDAAAESRLAVVVSRTACDDGAFLHETGLPLEIELGLEQRGLGAGEIGFLDRGVELDELGALLHVLAAIEEILHDDAAELRRHVHALDGDQRADRMHPVDPGLGLGRLGRDRGRRRRHLADEVVDHRRLEDEVEIGDAPEKQGDEDGGNEKALDHGRYGYCLRPVNGPLPRGF